MAATNEHGGNEGQNTLMVNDITHACFYLPPTSPIFVEVCDEDREEGDKLRCGELLVSMYGTRSAARKWHKC